MLAYFNDLRERVTTADGDWTVKGFIDIYSRIYTISIDTKVLSKVLELLMFPVIQHFADEYGYQIILAPAQNQYPDVTLIHKTNPLLCYAIDIKTTYHTKVSRDGIAFVNGMTLGTFQGYFRIRNRPVSSVFAYERYLKHYVLGVVYSRVSDIDERKVYTIGELNDIPSVATDFDFFLHEKYKIASDQPGSGNTKNIGSTPLLERLLNGTGVFSELGIEIFDDYWMNYQTRAMARDSGYDKPLYNNLRTYQAYKKQGSSIIQLSDDALETEADLFLDSPNDESLGDDPIA